MVVHRLGWMFVPGPSQVPLVSVLGVRGLSTYFGSTLWFDGGQLRESVQSLRFCSATYVHVQCCSVWQGMGATMMGIFLDAFESLALLSPFLTPLS